MYDVIVIGAGRAGAPGVMLLARKGYRDLQEPFAGKLAVRENSP